jgi:putative ABC transport system permease protein
MWFNALLLAWRSITRNWLRSSLTVLGVVIGVAAVVTMVTVGNGATLAIQNQITGLGTNLLQVRAGQRFGAGSGGVSPAFQAADATALAQQAPGVQAVAPEARTGSGSMRFSTVGCGRRVMRISRS